MISCTHCRIKFKTEEKNLNEGQVLKCLVCKGLTPYQGSRELPDTSDATTKYSTNSYGFSWPCM